MIGNRAAYFPDEGWVDPARLVSALLATARASGAVVRPHSAAVGMSMAGERIDGVRTCDGETVRTDAVVNCAGPGAAEDAALAVWTFRCATPRGCWRTSRPPRLRSDG